ncbi:autotransporter-associated N-terminal domain-containing protein [Leptotrichia sp. oral taxon 847]|uniref:autotransporter-associated N-terminal domain-containing protein n=1 Tax=Leptotrichia sp. oral taxon 847 TaxID=1785996 RepID=UPI000767FD2A|nr:autotransporter-associated N-terminal domain-containing protein [Leptotrichia sp. oral taxon 847]AMD94489.1 hypothetical protein AXF11_02005 [Leptotrichia sp. oral taxon 847]
MTNDLRILKKELKSFAKRVKDFKYTDSALITFLLTGLIMLSGLSLNLYSDEIKAQQEAINTSITQIRKDFKRARQENNKLLRNTNLELIQLMEQGDQVVKSPWSSWQFGMNYVYNDWQGTYKGRGDKTPNVKYKRNSEDKFGTYTGGKYGNTTLNKKVIEPISAVPVDAAVKPKNIQKTALNINLPTIGAPSTPNLNISVKAPEEIRDISINAPNKNINPVNPDANPFSDFAWGWMSSNVATPNTNASSSPTHSMGDNIDISGGTFWSGVNTDGTIANVAGYKNATQDTTIWNATGLPANMTYDRRHQSIINSWNGRWTGLHGNHITGGKFYVAGGNILSGSGATAEGTEVFHLVSDVEIENVTANLYGRAAFINAEAFRGGQTKMHNVTINVLKDWNTIFNIKGAEPGQDAAGYPGGQFSTLFGGNADITINTEKNTVYAVKNYAGGLRIENTGDIAFNGASNIGFSFLTWVPDKSKYIASQFPNYINGGNAGEGSLDKYIPYVKLDPNKPMKLYGDENVGIFFNKKSDLAHNVGIHQGYFELYFDIGSQLNSSGLMAQDAKGQINKTGYTAKTVDGNVGVYAISGQRTGVDVSSLSNLNFFSSDPIHDLNFGKFKITFGKYSKNGFMFLAKNGTVIDIQSTTGQTEFSDSINGGNIDQAKTGKGNIMVYAEGKWTAGGTGLTGTGLEDKPTEVKVNQKLKMVSDEGVAFMAKDGGKVTVTKDTIAYGYGSTIGYADGGTVEITGDITAKDEILNPATNRKDDRYTNIGLFATNKGTATLTKSAEIYGIGGLAKGESSVVNLNGDDNKISAGKETGLAALDGGIVNFKKGKITVKEYEPGSHKNATPFYAEGKDTNNVISKIKFNDDTTIDMYNGVLITGEDTDYDSTLGSTTAKYQGLNKVTVNIFGNKDVTLGSFKGKTLDWNSSTDSTTSTSSFFQALPGISKFAAINNTPGSSYRIILTSKIGGSDGILNVNAPTVTLDNVSDEYNNLSMADEMVKISNGTAVTGNIGTGSLVGTGKAQGLSMGSLKNETTNTRSGFENEGTVNVTGGTTANGIAGMNVSYGTIKNGTSKGSTATVTIDNGAGIYGTNGSKLENFGTINVTGSGAGIAARGTDKNTKQYYGTDDANFTYTPYTINIENHGAINVAGNNPVGIYAENNTQAGRDKVIVKNDSQLTVGNNGVGIAVLSSPIETGQKQGTPPVSVAGVNHGAGSDQGGTITVTASGAGSDIITGVNGKGIYAEDSDINLTGGDYVIETKEKGIGIFASGDTNVNGTLEYKYNGSTTGTGMGIVYDQDGQPIKTNKANVKLNNATNTTGGMIGLYTTAGTGNTFINQGDITGTSSALEFGIVSNGADVINDTGHKIELGNAAAQANANVGIYSKAKNKTVNKGSITVGDNAIGIYGYDVDNENGALIKAGDNGVAIYTQGNGTVNLNSGSTITVGKNQAVGVYAVGSGQNINANAGSSMTIGDNSFGIVNVGSGNTVTSNTTNPVTLGTDAVYVYQNDNTGHVFNYTPLTSTGDRNYGLYGNGTIENRGDINFSTGNGNVGVYSTGGTATNFANIKVGASNTAAKEYGVGMATGYYDDTPGSPTYGQTSNQGTVINRGTIEVSKPNTMGMYAVGSGSKAINYGNINLSGNNTIGMYIDRGATGENWGTIQTTAGGLTAVKGIYLANGSYIKNYGTINIAASDMKSAGIWSDTQSQANAEENASGVNPVTGISQTGTSTPAMRVVTADDMKEMGGVTIKVPPRATPVTVTDAHGNVIPIVKVDTDTPTPTPVSVTVTSPSGITTLNLAANNMQNFASSSEATSLGMYVDTSGVNYTNPIQGLSNLVGLQDINLYFGPEASRYTTSKAIEIGDNILKPYNDALRGLVTAGTTLYVTSPSLTWMAQPTKNAATGLLDKVYLVKVPYTAFAKDGDDQTYNFLAGLEQRYGVQGLGTKEKLIFDKISSLTGGEGHILAQAIDEMKGHQYSNIQQRTKETGDILSNEFNYLQTEWENPTKDNNKIKAFGHRGEYKTDTAGVIDYSNNAYGVAYVHENETVKLGNSSGWYAGAVTNRFKFKDLGKSREDQTMIKAGIFKKMSPASDHNGSLQWTISGEAFAGINHMKRRYWIVDDTFEAKSDYGTYGVALKNEVGKDFRTSERTSIRPYGALNLEYGRYTGIKEDGPMALEVRGNDYISVQPEAGVSFNYRQPVGVRSSIRASLVAAYTNELGKVNDVKNKAKLRGTDAEYYELRGDKENHKGSGKFDLNLGFENTRFGVTVNAGYDTKGENIRGGIGFRAIY